MTDKIARALFIGERLLSEYGMWKEYVEEQIAPCEFIGWLESPDGLKAVRDALQHRIMSYSLAYIDGIIGFRIWYKDGRTMESTDGTEAEVILTATEAFLRDE